MASAREFTFFGPMQGVGFRWTAKRLADAYGLSGWIKNNADGSVTLAVWGGDSDIDSFMSSFGDALGPYIQEVKSRPGKKGRRDEGFAIVR